MKPLVFFLFFLVVCSRDISKYHHLKLEGSRGDSQEKGGEEEREEKKKRVIFLCG